MKVTRLPSDPGPAGWNALLTPLGPARDLQHKVTADWLIIGAGFAGLAAARRLSELDPGGRIVVLEATRVGEGPAGRNSGFMIDLPHDLSSDDYGGALADDIARTEDSRRAIAFAADMAADYAMSAEAFTQSGKINAAATQKGHQHNLDYAQHLSQMQEPYRMLDHAEMRELTGSAFYQSGLFTPGAAMIQPAKFIRAVATGLEWAAVRIFEDSPVIELTRQGGWTARTPKGEVRAPKVILAVNGHLNSFGMMRGRLMHVFTYASMSRALEPEEINRLGGEPIWGATPADPMGTTVRRISGQGGHRIVIRNRFTFDPSMHVSPERITHVARDHDAAFAARFPMLGDVGMEYRWGGRLCLARNNVQVIGEPEPGLYTACCQNGLGTSRGTLAGMLAAELATGVTSPALERALAAPKPKKLPPEPIARIGANLKLRWMERAAGREL